MTMSRIDAGNYPLRQGQLPAFAHDQTRGKMRAMTRTVIERIEERLAALGKKAEGASKDAGLGRDFIRTLQRRPDTSPRADNLSALAKELGTTTSYLLGEVEDIEPSVQRMPVPAMITLPIRYEVAAGPWRAVDELSQEPLGWSEAQSFPNLPYPQWLERVVGDSFDREIPDGALIHVVDAVAMGYAPRHGDVVVVTRTAAQGGFVERTVKQIEIKKGQVELWPRSHNPKWSAPLAIADGAKQDTVVQIAAKVLRSYKVF